MADVGEHLHHRGPGHLAGVQLQDLVREAIGKVTLSQD